METKEMTCIICPMGCRLKVTADGDAVTVTGNTCKRGEKYGIQELIQPMRTVTTNVRCVGGDRPIVSVKTSAQVPKKEIGRVLAACKQAAATAPVYVGDVVVRDAAGTGADIVATCVADEI